MYGVDLQSLVEEQPYVPQEVMALQQQLQQVQGQFEYHQQQLMQQQYARLNQEIQAFQTAVENKATRKPRTSSASLTRWCSLPMPVSPSPFRRPTKRPSP